MQFNGHAILDFWPIALVAGGGLIAWGRHQREVEAIKESVAAKASTERVNALDSKLDTIDAKIDRLIDNMLEKAS